MQSNRLLFIGGPIDVGGAGKMLLFVANTCAPLYKSVYLYSIEQNSRPAGLSLTVDFISNPFKATNTNLWRLRTIFEIRKNVKRIKPDFICSFTTETATWVRFATLGLKTCVTSAERGDPFTLPSLWKTIARWVFQKSDACFFQLEHAIDFYGDRIKNKSFVIPNPFILKTDVEIFNGVRNKSIVSAGRFVVEKGFDVLIEAYSIVVKKHPDYKLIIWGEGPLLDDYKNQTEKLGISNRVSFPGYSNNVAASVQKEGIFVLSSRYEGIPNVLIEALSIGIPVITTDCSPGGPRFLVNDGERGLIVNIDDVTNLANSINNLIENEELYRKFEIRGPEIRSILSKEKIAGMWIEAINNILSQSVCKNT